MSTDEPTPTQPEESTTEAAETAAASEGATESAKETATDEAAEATHDDVSAAETAEESSTPPSEPSQEPAATMSEATPAPAEPAPEAAPAKAAPSAASHGKQGPAWGQIALFGGGAIAILVLLFMWVSGGGAAGDVVQRMPASATAVMGLDLGVVTEDPSFATIADLATSQVSGSSKALLDAIPLTSLKTLGCALDKSMKTGACVLGGDFDAEKVGAILRNLNSGWKEEVVAGKTVWSEDDPNPVQSMALAVFDEKSLIGGSKPMVLETIRSMTGEGKAVADNENLSTALGHIDTGATFVMAADKVKTNDTETLSGETDTDSPLVTFGVSVNLGDDLVLNVFLKGENERAKQDLIQARLGFQMAKSVAGPAIDQAMSQVPAGLTELANSWATFAKEFVASLDVEDVDGGIALSASASLPEGGLVGALAQAAPMLMGFYSMTDIVPGEALQQVEEVESPMNTYAK